MDDQQLIQLVERYVQGEMQAEEQAHFEYLRASDARTGRFIEEHIHFLEQVKAHGERNQFLSIMQDVHAGLMDSGEIKLHEPKTKVIDMWKRSRRVIAVAACIGGLTAFAISGMVVYFTPKATPASVEQLKRKINRLEQDQYILKDQLNNERKEDKIPVDASVQSGGTSFLIDAKGYLVTNAHVIGESKNVVVQNYKGQEFKARIIKIDPVSDLAILRIDDNDFKPAGSLPYGFKKTGADLSEEIFTLGFPKDEIVYGEGYMSAKTGFNGDTLACQIAVAANPGNSGGPVINKNGEVIGILSTRQVMAEGVVFAVKTKNIYKALDDAKQTDTSFQSIRLSTASALKGVDRVQQIKKIQDCIFMVKTY
ncbi:MAG: trypsin-like peptidase domain-containing protein [Williamsia sp.]|nr:trypsin-like peptidase domain-containing protein [Williamsia sp.]